MTREQEGRSFAVIFCAHGALCIVPRRAVHRHWVHNLSDQAGFRPEISRIRNVDRNGPNDGQRATFPNLRLRHCCHSDVHHRTCPPDSWLACQARVRSARVVLASLVLVRRSALAKEDPGFFPFPRFFTFPRFFAALALALDLDLALTPLLNEVS
jgi:hypothetical protein